MANYNATSMADALKRVYTPKRKLDLITRDSPLLRDLPKDTTMSGAATVVNWRINISPTRSNDITQVATNSASSAGPLIKSLLLTPVFDHSWKVVDHETILKSEREEGSYWNAVKLAAEDAMIELGQNISRAAFRGGYGAQAQIDSIDTSSVTLKNNQDAIAFIAGQVVQFSQFESGSALRDSGDSLTVLSVDVPTGVITFTTVTSGISGLTDGDFIFTKGDRDDNVSTAMTNIAGLSAYGPSSAVSSSDSFFGVNRSTDSRMQFCRVSGSLSDIGGSLRQGAMQVAAFGRGTKLDKFYMSYNTLDQLLANASSQILRVPGDKTQPISFERLFLNTPNGPVELVGDHNCQDNICWGLKLDTWKLFSHGDLVRLYNEDGLSQTRNSTNGIEIRYFFYGQLACYMPGMNVRVDLS